MLSKQHVKEHAKFAVYTHLVSAFLIVLLSTAIPTIISNVVQMRFFSSADLLNGFDMAQYVISHAKEYLISQGIIILSLIINLPFEYCLMRYFLVLSGTPVGVKCSFRVFFSGCENVGAFIKGAFIVLLWDILSAVGVFVGFFPVYLAFCMAPFFLAVNPSWSVFKCFSESRRLMKGHKKQAFAIILEFLLLKLGANLLSSLGVAFLSTLIDLTAHCLMYTALAVIFMRLNHENSEEPKTDTPETEQ